MPILARLIVALWGALLFYLLVDAAMETPKRVAAAIEQSINRAHGR